MLAEILGSHSTRAQQEEMLVCLVMDASLVQDLIGGAVTDETQQRLYFFGRELCSALQITRSACLLLGT